MPKKPVTGRKTSWIPKILLQPWRRAAYDECVNRRRRTDPDITMAEWVRQALDDCAKRELNRKSLHEL